MQFGYARVSTHEQSAEAQRQALREAGCERVFSDTCSGSVACVDRPELQALGAQLRPGDGLVVWRLDRLGRNLRDLLDFVSGLERRQVQFHSLQEQMDTSTAVGRMIFQVFGALAEYERGLMRERTLAGLAAARASGRKGGRPRALREDDLRVAAALLRTRNISVMEICRTLGVGKSTLYRHLAPDGSRRRPPRDQPPGDTPRLF